MAQPNLEAVAMQKMMEDSHYCPNSFKDIGPCQVNWGVEGMTGKFTRAQAYRSYIPDGRQIIQCPACGVNVHYVDGPNWSLGIGPVSVDVPRVVTPDTNPLESKDKFGRDVYFCEKCQRNHISNSQIGIKHR